MARGRASLVEVLGGDDLDDLPYRTQQGIEAMQEVLRTFNTTVFQMTIDSVERTNEDLEKFVPASCGRDDFREILGGKTMRNRHRHAW